MGIKKLSTPATTAISKIGSVTDSGIRSVNGIGYLGGNSYNMLFDGTDDALDLDAMKGEIDVNTGTFSGWIRMTDDDGTNRVFSCQVDDNNMIELLWVGASDYFRGKYRGNSNSSLVNTGATSDYYGGDWYHVVMTWDTGGGDKLQMYVNGSTANNVTGLDDSFTGSLARANIGAKADSSLSGFIACKMDEIAIFDEVKDLAWVVSAYNNGVPTNLYSPDQTGLVAYYRFENGSGNAVNSVGTGDAVLVNTPTYTTSNLITI